MVRITPCPCWRCRSQPDHPEAGHHTRLRSMLQRLDEQQRRLLVGLEALRLGHGGTRTVAEIAEMAERTVRRGRREVLAGFTTLPTARIRHPGAGRPRTEKKGLALSGA